MARPHAQGRTKKMIMRWLKRCVIREIHRAMTTDRAPATTTPTKPPPKPLDIQGSFGTPTRPSRRKSRDHL